MSELALRLPMNYVEVDRDEMEYVDGGYYLSHNTCLAIDFAIGASASEGIGAVASLVGAAAAYVGTVIAASIPAIGWIIGIGITALVLNQAWSIASALVTDLVHGNGIDIGLGWYFATPYLSFSPR